MPDLDQSRADSHTFDAVVIGAGFSGLYQLHCLRDRLGLNARVLEAADGVGGTWYWNRYPGARCDSESHSYCYSFSPELQQEWDWTERYPEQPEIMRYLNHVADRFDLKCDIQFNTRVTHATYDEAANRWLIDTDRGERFAAQWLITAVGCLSTTNIPRIDGLESFAGRWYHTGQWPHEGVDFRGKRVGLIGTGSTGIQATPVIAETAAHLTVFQRTPNYSVPACNGPLDEATRRQFKADAEAIRQICKSGPNGHPWIISETSALDVAAEQREAIYEAAWQYGGLRFRAAFQDLLTNKEANDTAAEFIRNKIRQIVNDPAVAAKLIPTDHPFAAKRPPIDTGYFETFNRDNVTLIDLRETPIERIIPEGIQLRDGTAHALDIIVFATGFDAMTGPLLKLDIRGRGGRSLQDAWAEGPRTYLGLQVAGFPNLFTITGPGSPSVLCNMPVAIEQHVDWITDCISHLRKQGLTRIEPTEDAVERWIKHNNAAADATLLPQAGHSWYLGANVPGKPRVFMPYAGGMAHYARVCEDVATADYAGFALSS